MRRIPAIKQNKCALNVLIEPQETEGGKPLFQATMASGADIMKMHYAGFD